MTNEKKSIDTGGGAYVEGQVEIHMGDFVGRDKVVATSSQGITVEEFAKLLDQVRQLLPQAGLDSSANQIIEGDFKVIEDEAAKEKPNGAIIKGKLKGVSEMLTNAGGAAEGVEKIVSLLTKAVKWTGTLFL